MPPNHSLQQLSTFTLRLARIQHYLNSSKLHFTAEDTLELNPAPFRYAQAALPPQSPLSYLLLFMGETCWSTEDLEGRRIMVQALKDWCLGQLTQASQPTMPDLGRRTIQSWIQEQQAEETP